MNLSEVLKQWRWATKLGTREAAKIIGISNSTYSRVERGYQPDGYTLATILKWLLAAAQRREILKSLPKGESK